MKIIITAAFLCLTLTACEMFVIGSKKKPQVEISQNSPIGAVLLFKAKLDSNNVQDASHLMLKPDGREYIAIEKYELYDDLERLSRIISNKPVTEYKTDTLSVDKCSVNIVFDYIKNYKFETRRIVKDWFITGYKKY